MLIESEILKEYIKNEISDSLVNMNECYTKNYKFYQGIKCGLRKTLNKIKQLEDNNDNSRNNTK